MEIYKVGKKEKEWENGRENLRKSINQFRRSNIWLLGVLEKEKQSVWSGEKKPRYNTRNFPRTKIHAWNHPEQ